MTMIDQQIAYQALVSHDARFDGIFFVGVSSTGIYCRPICPARTPKLEHCLFFQSREAAEQAAFRPCLRCRPELTPGQAPVDNASRIAHLLVRQMEEGLVNEDLTIKGIAKQLALSPRQLGRIIQKEFGVSPSKLLQTRRLLLAKQLLSDTKLAITEVAFASGFLSLRRFNDAFSKQYKMPPTRLRKENNKEGSMSRDTLSLQLHYHPPYAWHSLLQFLSLRRLQGIEFLTKDSYYRTVRCNEQVGFIKVEQAASKDALLVELSHSLLTVLPALLGRLRCFFDLNSRPELIQQCLSKDAILKESLQQNPGLRVPGAMDGFELAVRAILGQQISVKAATTLANRFTMAFSERIVTPYEELTLLTPTPERVAQASLDELGELGIIRRRALSILALAEAMAAGKLQLNLGFDPEATIKQLTALPGIGHWTAHYIALRALHWPDALPKEDLILRKNLGGLTAKQVEERSQLWRPWRSYALLHVWALTNSKAEP